MEFFKVYFADVVKNHYADFKGKADRKQFWYFVLNCILISIILSILTSVLGKLGGALGMLFSLAVIIPSLAIGARRLHDIDKSGWWQLIALIPAIGALILIILLALPSKSPTRFD